MNGTDMPSGALRCMGCGTVGYQSDRYCPCCGLAMTRSCGSCGATIGHPIAYFCTECGATLDDAPPLPE